MVFLFAYLLLVSLLEGAIFPDVHVVLSFGLSCPCTGDDDYA